MNCEKTITTENGCIDKANKLDKNKSKISLIEIDFFIFFKIQKKTKILNNWKNKVKQRFLASFEIQIKKTLKVKIYNTRFVADFFNIKLDKKNIIIKQQTPNVIWNIFEDATEYSNIWKYKFKM